MKKINLLVGISILLLTSSTFSDAWGQGCVLPEEFPSSINELESANRTIAECFAPTIHQMANGSDGQGEGGLGELIVSPFYDDSPGNSQFGNNWEGLENFDILNPTSEIHPHVFYSVIWEEFRWIVTYAFYHARDFADPAPPIGLPVCCGDNHEHDMEGAIFVIARESQTIISVSTISHGNIILNTDIIGVDPDIFIDNGTHAVDSDIGNGCIADTNPCKDCRPFSLPHIVYTFDNNISSLNLQSEVLTFDGNLIEVVSGTGTYTLEDIFSSDPNSLSNLSDNPQFFDGGSFNQEGNTECQDEGSASAPWAWSQFLFTKDELNLLLCASAFGGRKTIGANIQQALQNDGAMNACNLNPPNLNFIYNPYFPDPTCLFFTDVTISSNEVWDDSEDHNFNSITIESGTSLDIVGTTVNFSSDGFLKLEKGAQLNLSGAILEDCGEMWQGVIAESGLPGGLGSTPASINMTNGSEIRNAEVGARLSDANGNSFVVILTPFGSINLSDRPTITCYDSGFNGCFNGVVFGAGNTTSIFNNAWFSNIVNLGIYAGRNSTNVKVLSSDFTNVSIAIQGVDSDFTILDGNEFNGGNFGVTLSGTYPLSSGSIIGSSRTSKNTFSGQSFEGVLSFGTSNPTGVVIINNEFELIGRTSVKLIGDNLSRISNNNFSNSQWGVSFDATGFNANFIQCNEYENIIEVDNIFTLENPLTTFLGNRALGGNNINFGLETATVRPNIGNPDIASGNCFDVGARDIVVSGGIPFNYYWFDTNIIGDCQKPINPGPSPSTFSAIVSSAVSNNCPGGFGVFNLVSPTGDTTEIDIESFTAENECLPCLEQAIDYWLNEVQNEGGFDPRLVAIDPISASIESVDAMNNLDEWMRFGIFVGTEIDSFSFSQSILAPYFTFKYRKFLYGLHLLNGDTSSASEILNGLIPSNADEINFIATQGYNLQTIVGDTLDQIELDDLESLALEPYPSAGYAYALYYVLTGIMLDRGMPDFPPESGGSRVGLDNLLPTPSFVETNSNFSGVTIDKPRPDEKYSIRIFDTAGKLVYYEKNTKERIDTSKLITGIYFIQMISKDGSFLVDKFFKL